MKKLLIIIGSPLWVPILITVSALILSLFAMLFAVIILFWAVFASLAASSFASIIIGLLNIIDATVLIGSSLIGFGFVLAGLAIFVFFGCIYATKCALLITKKSMNCIMKLF